MQPKRARPDYDQALKQLLTRAHDGFLALIAPGLAWRGERSPELATSARRADLVWEVESGAGERALLHVELQTKVEADIGERIAEYALRLYRRDHLPIETILVFLRPAPSVPEPGFGLPGIGRERMRDAYAIIRLWEIPQERVLDTPEYALWPLAGLMAGVTVETAMRVAERIAVAPAPLEERRELTGPLVTLAGMRLPRRALIDTVRRNPVIDELLRESSVAEEFIEEGFKQGREQGREQGMRMAARLALQGRLGALDQALLDAIERADEATLERVLLHATTDTPEEIRARLGL